MKSEVIDIGIGRIALIAHRGKGPTARFTAPTEALWQECKNKGLLIDGLVPEEILTQYNRDHGLPTLFEKIPPENTIEAFKVSLDEGADGIELDVFLSKDNVPVVIHDNELNRVVMGARRGREAEVPGAEGHLGFVEDYTVEELKKFNLGMGAKIPTLQEVVDFIGEEKRGSTPLIGRQLLLNIEFKDNTRDIVKHTNEVVRNAIEAKKIDFEDVVYCSFKHDALVEVMKIDPKAFVAPQLKTAFLFGHENVDPEKGWTVPIGTRYKEDTIARLGELVDNFEKIEKDHGGKIVGLDVVLWDVEEELVNFAQSRNIPLWVSTSDYRNFDNVAFIGSIVNMTQKIDVGFKVDEPGRIGMHIDYAYAYFAKDITSCTIQSVSTVANFADSDLRIDRLPKPWQEIRQEHYQQILDNFTPKLQGYIIDRSISTPVSTQEVNFSSISEVMKQASEIADQAKKKVVELSAQDAIKEPPFKTSSPKRGV